MNALTPTIPSPGSPAAPSLGRSVRSGVAVVIPAFRVTRHILPLLERFGPEVAAIYVVDDACPDGSGDLVAASCADPRVHVLRNARNRGVGGAVMHGLRAAHAAGYHVAVKIDGDGQMDPALVPRFVAPILDGRADYTKGNRFYDPRSLRQMPRGRRLGNALLSFTAKFSTGYWDIFDPTNGLIALDLRLLPFLTTDKVAERYFFESDLLFRAGLVKARVIDIPMAALYADETSHLSAAREGPRFIAGHCRNFAKRIGYTYFLRDFGIASVELVVGLALLLFSVVVGVPALVTAEADSAGRVMLAALPLLVGVQFLLSALNYDVRNTPTTPVSDLLPEMPLAGGKPGDPDEDSET